MSRKLKSCISTFMLTITIASMVLGQSVPPQPTAKRDRFGAYHWTGDFTAWPFTPDRLNWGADLASSVNTKTLRVGMGPSNGYNINTQDSVWIEDAVPAGGVQLGEESWNFVSANPIPLSGNSAHQSALMSGSHQHFFVSATDTLRINSGDVLFTYAYLDPANPPSEIMLQWTEGTTFEHRAYWGSNIIGLGTDGTASRRFMGPLPPTGKWVRLEVPASSVGVEGLTLNGMAFSLYNGRVTWDRAGATKNETVWIEDAVPAGGIQLGEESWNFVSTNPAPFSGNSAHQSALMSGSHQHLFVNATNTLTVNTGDNLFTYVYLDPANLPSEIMLQWTEGTTWEHRAYWGSDIIGLGTINSASRRFMGPLPPTGKWVRLEVPASSVGVEGLTLNGMAFSLYNGRVTWDRTGVMKNETVWIEDAVPDGATPSGSSDTWNFVSANPTPLSGKIAHKTNLVSGIHKIYFSGAQDTMKVNTGDNLFAYVYLDPVNPPSEVMLEWNDGTWEHRAYWGANLIDPSNGCGSCGTDGTNSRRNIGSLPPTGRWVRLEVAASRVGLDGRTINGFSLSLYHGRATFDRAGKIPDLAQVAATQAYDTLFSNPNFNTYLITTYSSGDGNNNWLDGYTAEESLVERNEIGRLGDYLLYPGRYPNKTFIILNWEGDHAFADSKENQTVWIEDAVPAGGIQLGEENWNFVSANPAPFFGTSAHQSALMSGSHQHLFVNATSTLTVNTGDNLFTYVYLDPANPPSEIMLQWTEGTTWEHRAYWGSNIVGLGTDGTASRRFMGPLPPTGKWVRLEVPASSVGVEGLTLNGMAFSLYNGRATWDHTGADRIAGNRNGPTNRWDDFKNWIQVRSDGVKDARGRNSGSSAHLYSGLEFFQTYSTDGNGDFYLDQYGQLVRCGTTSDNAFFPNKYRCVIDYVAPQVDVDYYSFSSWQTINLKHPMWAGPPYYGGPTLSLRDTFKSNLGFALNKVKATRPSADEVNFIVGEWAFYPEVYGDNAVSYVNEMFGAFNLDDPSAFHVSYLYYWQTTPGLFNSIGGTITQSAVGAAFKNNLP